MLFSFSFVFHLVPLIRANRDLAEEFRKKVFYFLLEKNGDDPYFDSVHQLTKVVKEFVQCEIEKKKENLGR